MNTTQTGSNAERLVADYLAVNKYKIIELNWKRPHAEIDIIAVKDKTVFFVEVKYRSNLDSGDGFDYITKNKLNHMNRAAESWVQENAWQGPYELLVASVHKDSIDLREV